jgi:hypothetical protein
MSDILVRVETQDFDAWLKTVKDTVADRGSYGISDAHIYRDTENPNAALFHLRVDDEGRAMEWFRSARFQEVSKMARITGREFYFGEKRDPSQPGTPNTSLGMH